MSEESTENFPTPGQLNVGVESLGTAEIVAAEVIVGSPNMEVNRPFMLDFDLDLVPLTPNDPPQKCPKYIKDKHPEWVQG